MKTLLDFAYQHYAKNLFDQKRLKEALSYFEKAMILKLKRKAPQEQIDSTKFAIQIVKEKMRSLD